jgi:hypothetical protein
MNTNEDRHLSIQNQNLREENLYLQKKVEELDKLIDYNNFQIKEEIFHQQRKLFELNNEFKYEKDINHKLNKAIELIKYLCSEKNSLKDAIGFFGGYNEFFSICNFIMICIIDKKDDLKAQNIDLVEKIILLAEEYKKLSSKSLSI